MTGLLEQLTYQREGGMKEDETQKVVVEHTFISKLCSFVQLAHQAPDLGTLMWGQMRLWAAVNRRVRSENLRDVELC